MSGEITSLLTNALLQHRVAVGCMLLGGLFIYDIFWVSCSHF